MAETHRIGVLTFHRSINYGSYWQARCLLDGLRSRGRDAELLDHDCGEVRRAEIRCALQPELPRRTPRRHLRRYVEKARRLDRAISQLPLSAPFPLQDPRQAADYEAIVVGSDEVWNFRHPWYGGKPIFFGDGLKTSRLVSYAASFGNHSANDGIDSLWADKLHRFSELSVRDENSLHLIRSGTGRLPALVLDPCLQFPRSARFEASGQPYALVYGHSFPRWFQARICDWAERGGHRLLSVGYANAWSDDERVEAGPIEFAQLVAAASAVITNFFHGCVFAILHGKPWLSCSSDYRSIKVRDLVSLLHDETRLVDERVSAAEIAQLLATPVQERVNERIAELRAHSNTYLDAALS